MHFKKTITPFFPLAIFYNISHLPEQRMPGTSKNQSAGVFEEIIQNQPITLAKKFGTF
jgi:hypothetical protein